MIWVRGFVALLISVFVLGGMAVVGLQIAGLFTLSLPSTPGLSAAELAAVSAPYADVVAGRDQAVIERLAAGVDRSNAEAGLAQIRSVLPAAQPTSTRLLRWAKAVDPGGEHLFGAQEYVYPEHVVLVQTELFRSNAANPWSIGNFHVNAATKQELAANKLTLTGKAPAFVAIVLAAALIPLLTYCTAMSILLRKGQRRRWLWFFAVIICLTTLSLNGATGAIGFNPLSVQVFGGSALSSGSAFDPWVFGVSLPLGALFYWLAGRRKAPGPAPAFA
jgi:hypothetical protein